MAAEVATGMIEGRGAGVAAVVEIRAAPEAAVDMLAGVWVWVWVFVVVYCYCPYHIM